MISKVLIQRRINDIEHSILPQDIDSTYVKLGRIDILYWLINNEIEDKERVLTKIKRIQEEMIPLQANDVMYQEKQARIKELEFCMRDS